MKKKKQKFDFTITTLAGARISVFIKLSYKYGIEKKYFAKWALSGIVSLIVTILSVFDQIIFRWKTKPTNQKPPVFVLGHWRSGTTLLHNLLCLDPESGYTTTYQTVFPNNLFAFSWLFKPIMKSLMPNSRPVDNVKLDVEFPQEEEFALNNEIPFSYYNWWYFPKHTQEIKKRYLLDETTTASDWMEWKDNYTRFVQRCQLNTKGTRFVSKNPPNTARIPQLLELFPDAKFVYIHRNPYEVVRSTYAFYKGVLPAIQLQDIDDDVLLTDILNGFSEMIDKYEKEKNLIPTENLLEIPYSTLVDNPKDSIKELYANLLRDDFERVEGLVSSYLSNQSHNLKEYQFEPEFVEKVNEKLLNVIQKQGYPVMD